MHQRAYRYLCEGKMLVSDFLISVHKFLKIDFHFVITGYFVD